MEIIRQYKLVIKIINSTVLNKLQSYGRISALGPDGHCTSRFKRAMCISCRPHVDVYKGVLLIWTHVDRGKRQKSDFCVDVINGWPLRPRVSILHMSHTVNFK